MTRDEAWELVNKWTENKNLIKHMLAVEAQMLAIHKYLEDRGEDCAETADVWGLAGLIHDADYQRWPKEHPRKTLEWLKENKAPDWLYNAVKRHAWKFNDIDEPPETKMEWSLYTCDELSGFIIACALVRPDKKLASLTVESIMKKWPQKSFAAGVHREQVELCEEKLGIKLGDYIRICLEALQSIAPQLEL